MSDEEGFVRRGKEPFGQVAVRKGFVTQPQVQCALNAQRLLGVRGEKHKLIGLVMLELGLLGTTELIAVLQELSRPAHSTTSVPVPIVALRLRR